MPHTTRTNALRVINARLAAVAIAVSFMATLSAACGDELVGGVQSDEGAPQSDAGVADDAGPAQDIGGSEDAQGQAEGLSLDGSFETTFRLDISDEFCADGQWTGNLTFECFGGFDCEDVEDPGARVFLWRYETDEWIDLGDLSLGFEQSEQTIDISATGATCRDMATAMVFFPTATGGHGGDEVNILRKGSSNGFSIVGSQQGEGTEVSMHCDPEVAVRAEVIVYNYAQFAATQTLELEFRPSEDPQDSDWFGTIGATARTEIIAMLGYDAEGEIRCSIFR